MKTKPKSGEMMRDLKKKMQESLDEMEENKAND